jgi:intracellular multiplication protein IcmK
MKLKATVVAFSACFCSVLWAQNVQGGKASNQPARVQRNGAVIENFPTREEAQQNWQKAEPPATSSVTNGPSNDIGPAGSPASTGPAKGSRRVAGRELPDPKLPAKVDYAAEATERTAPMSPAEIRRFSDSMIESARAMAEIPGGPYTVRGSRIMPISFEPNSKPGTVEVALNLGALLTFVDRSGTPLIVDGAKTFGNAFSVGVLSTDEVKERGSSTVEVTAQSITGTGNMMVRLQGVPNPVLLQVRVGSATKTVDSVIQVVVPVLTAAKSVLPGDRLEADGGMQVGEMQGFLMGIPPEGAVDVKVSQVASTSAWMWRGHLYVRTPHTIFSPGWFNRQAAVDGTAVYKLPYTSLVRMGVDGREVNAVMELPYIPPVASTAR